MAAAEIDHDDAMAALAVHEKEIVVGIAVGSSTRSCGCDAFCVDQVKAVLSADRGPFLGRTDMIVKYSERVPDQRDHRTLAEFIPGELARIEAELIEVPLEAVPCEPHLLHGLDVLLVGGGDDDSSGPWGLGQRECLGERGLVVIRERVAAGCLVYVGICAGAYLGSAKPGNLGLCDCAILTGSGRKEVLACGVRGPVELAVPVDDTADDDGSADDRHMVCRLRRAFREAGSTVGDTMTIRFDDSAVFVDVDSSVGVIARYASTVSAPQFQHPVWRSRGTYEEYADQMLGKAAVLFGRFGGSAGGRVLLIGPHPELHPQEDGKSALEGEGKAATLLGDLLEALVLPGEAKSARASDQEERNVRVRWYRSRVKRRCIPISVP